MIQFLKRLEGPAPLLPDVSCLIAMLNIGIMVPKVKVDEFNNNTLADNTTFNML